MSKPIALITTSSGQDSFYLSKLLSESDYFVVGLVSNNSAGDLSYFHRVLPFSFTETKKLIDFMMRHNVTEVFNLAAQSSVLRSWSEPELTFEVNYYAVKRLLECMKKKSTLNKVKFFQASTTDMFGKRFVSLEYKNLSPWSPYGESKLAAYLLVDQMRNEGLHCFSGVLTNHDSPIRKSTFVIPKLAKQISEVVLGSRKILELENWNVARDWAHAEDVVLAMYKAMKLEYPIDILIATGNTNSLKVIAEKAITELNVDASFFTEKKLIRPRDLLTVEVDARKYQKFLDWTPNFTNHKTLLSLVNSNLTKIGIFK
jgi:GDPmannose 4,6-dehydratase